MSGYGDTSYGDAPYGNDPGVSSISPEAARMIHDIFSYAWGTNDVESWVGDSMNSIGASQSMELTSQENSCLQTKLMQVIEAEGRTVPQTQQYKLAVKALWDLQNTPPVL